MNKYTKAVKLLERGKVLKVMETDKIIRFKDKFEFLNSYYIVTRFLSILY